MKERGKQEFLFLSITLFPLQNPALHFLQVSQDGRRYVNEMLENLKPSNPTVSQLVLSDTAGPWNAPEKEVRGQTKHLFLFRIFNFF